MPLLPTGGRDDGFRQIGVDRHVEARRPALDPTQQQMLHGVDAEGAARNGVAHCKRHLLDPERPHQAQDLDELSLALFAQASLWRCGCSPGSWSAARSMWPYAPQAARGADRRFSSIRSKAYKNMDLSWWRWRHRSKFDIPLSSQATASPSGINERERRPPNAATISGKRAVRSFPARLYSRARLPSLRATMRTPSCLISCTHSAPVGGCGALVGRHGATRTCRVIGTKFDWALHAARGLYEKARRIEGARRAETT